MSVVRCAPHWKGRDGSFENVQNNRVSRTWIVVTDDKNDNQFTISSYFATDVEGGIVFLTPHPDANAYTARGLQADQQDESPFWWMVTVTYSTEPLKADEEERQAPNPLDRPARITWDSENAQEFTVKDKDDEAMLNSAGDPLEPVEKDDIRWIISITKNFEELPDWVIDTVNCVNSSAITVSGKTLPARTVKVNRLRIGELQIDNDVPYYEVTVELAYKKGTWDVKRLDEGFNVIAGDGKLEATDKKRILVEDDDGEFQPPTEAIPLDGEGGILEFPTPDTAQYITFKIYEEEDLNDLPFA